MGRFIEFIFGVVVLLVLAAPAQADVRPAAQIPVSAYQEVHSDLPEREYQALVSGLAARNYRLVAASASRIGGRTRFSAITEAVRDGRAWRAAHGRTAGEMAAFIDDYVGRRGWTLRSLDVYATANGFRYLALIDDEPRGGPYRSPELEIEGSAWNTAVSARLQQSLYPAIASVAVDDQGRVIVAAQFAPLQGRTFVSYQGRDRNQMIQDHRSASARGLGPVHMTAFPAAGRAGAYSGVWLSGAQPGDVLVGVPADRVEAVITELHRQNRPIRSVSQTIGSDGRPTFAIRTSRSQSQAPLNPDGARFQASSNTPPPPQPGSTGSGAGGQGGAGTGSFGGGFSGGDRVGGGPNRPSPPDPTEPNPPSPEPPDPPDNPAHPVQPGDPSWCSYYTYGGSHVGLSIRSPGESPLVSRNWGVVLCSDETHQSELERGRRAMDHYLGIRVPWAQATNVAEAASCLRAHRVQWIWEYSDDPEVRRALERVAGSIWDGIDAEACEACGRMIAIAGMDYCAR